MSDKCTRMLTFTSAHMSAHIKDTFGSRDNNVVLRIETRDKNRSVTIHFDKLHVMVTDPIYYMLSHIPLLTLALHSGVIFQRNMTGLAMFGFCHRGGGEC